MSGRSFLPLFLAGAALASIGCGEPDSELELAVGEQTSVSADGSGSASASAFEQHIRPLVERDERERLDRVLGRLTRGDALVYKGTFAARDNRGTLPADRDGVMPNGTASALLESQPEGILLSVFGRNEADERSKVDFFQFSGAGAETEVSPVSSVFTIAGTRQLGKCAGCLVDLRARPGSIPIVDLVARGHFFDIHASPFRIMASGSLSVVPPTELTFEDVASVRSLDGFIREGDYMIQHRDEFFHEELPSGCSATAKYSIRTRIHRTRPADHGIANFVLESGQRCCFVSGGSACTSVAAPKSVRTGVGNVARASIADIDLSSATKYTLRLGYVDTTRYFGSSTHIRAVAIVHTRRGAATEGQTVEVPLRGEPRQDGSFVYEADVSFSHEAPIVFVEAAFEGGSGRIWDSNLSRNYKLEVGFVSHHPPG